MAPVSLRHDFLTGPPVHKFKKMVRENLNYKNYWNELFAKYPDSVTIFCNWIDAYKRLNDWKGLFNSDSNWQDAEGKNAPAPKFHEIPLAMQVGILIEFISECPMESSYWKIKLQSNKDWAKEFEFFFSTLHYDKGLREAFVNKLNTVNKLNIVL